MGKKIILLTTFLLLSIISHGQTHGWIFKDVEDTYGKTIYSVKGVYFESGQYDLIVNSVLIEKKNDKYKKAKVKTSYGYHEIKELPNFLNGVMYYVYGEKNIDGTPYIRFSYNVEGKEVIFLIPKDIFREIIFPKHIIDPAFIDNEINQIWNKYTFLNLKQAYDNLPNDYNADYKNDFCKSRLIALDISNQYTERISNQRITTFEWEDYQYGTPSEPYYLYVFVGGERMKVKYSDLRIMIKTHSLIPKTERDSMQREEFVKDSIEDLRKYSVIIGFYKYSSHYKDSVAFYQHIEDRRVGKYLGYSRGEAVSYNQQDVTFVNRGDGELLKKWGISGSQERMNAAKEYDSLYVIREKKRAEILREKKAREAETRRQDLIKRYGKTYGQLIFEGKVRIGMTKEMCREAWGEPTDINRTITKYSVHEQWVYSHSSYLYFDDGKLTSIQN